LKIFLVIFSRYIGKNCDVIFGVIWQKFDELPPKKKASFSITEDEALEELSFSY